MNIMNDLGESGNSAPMGGWHDAVLQDQYEAKVLALVIRDLATVAPAAGESVVMKLVADVWEQAAEHLRRAGTTWTHLSWFVQDAIARFVGGVQPQMAGR